MKYQTEDGVKATNASNFMSFCWGMGTIAPAIVLTATNILLLRFMTDYVGIGAALAGGLIALSKIYDAVTDPLMGMITDFTRSKIGRRRPYLLLGGALLSFSIFLLFNPPQLDETVKTYYMTFALIVFATAYTIYNVPYLAMPVEMTSSYHGRSKLMSFRVYAFAGANLLAAVGGPILIAHYGGGLEGHKVMSFILAPLVMVSAIVAFQGTKNAPYISTLKKTRPSPISKQLKAIIQSKPFFALMMVKLFSLMILGVQAAYPFFFTQILDVSDKILGLYFFALTISLVAFQPIWLWASRRIGKKSTYIIALSLGMITAPTWALAEAGEPLAFMLLRAVALGAAGGGSLLMGQSMLPDTQEYDTLRSGRRREGLMSGLYTTMEKLAQAIGVAVIGVFLGTMGYVASTGEVSVEQPQSAVMAIYVSVAVFPAIVSLIALLLLMFFYHLSETELNNLRDSYNRANIEKRF